MADVVIVGNSLGNLQHEVGDLIDSSDLVVRFNDYKILGYEKYVGTKTDYVWVSGQFYKSILPNLKTIIKLISPHNLDTYPQNYPQNYITIPLINDETVPNFHWSSGVHVIKYFLDLGHNVKIHGICDGVSAHYWNKNFKIWGKHDYDMDRKKIESWGISRLVINK